MKRCLFIGGVADGKTVIVDDTVNRNYFDVPVASENTTGGFRYVTYRRAVLCGSTGQEFDVFYTGSGDVIEQLINGYKGQS